MERFILYNANTRKRETVTCCSAQEAFELVHNRNRKEHSQPWRAYDEWGYRIVGLYQNNDSGCFERVMKV